MQFFKARASLIEEALESIAEESLVKKMGLCNSAYAVATCAFPAEEVIGFKELGSGFFVPRALFTDNEFLIYLLLAFRRFIGFVRQV